MRVVFLVFSSNFKRALSDKRKFIINLLIPVATIILAMFVNYVSTPSITIGVVKNNDFDEENRIISLLDNTKGINVKIIEDNLLKSDTILGKYGGVIVFDKSFEKNEVKELDNYLKFYNVKDEKTNDMMKNLIKVYLKGNNPIDMESAISEMESGTLTRGERVIAFLATVLLISAVVNAAILIKDRDENTFNRFIYSPNNKFKYIMGNILYNYVFSYMQLFIAITITQIIGMDLGLSLGTLLCYGMILTLLMTTFGTFIACIFKKELYANLFAAAISLILSLVGGTFIIYDKMPKGLQLLSTITPNRWIIKSVQYLETGLVNNINPIIVLIGFSIIFALAATFINVFRKVEFKS
ncbi:MAG: ABC transporter permease [Clostridiaceae bacterium]